MANHKIAAKSCYSFVLEERIEVPYQVIGYPDWLERCIPASLKSIQKPIRPGNEAYDLVPYLGRFWRMPVLGIDLETGGPKEKDGLDPVSLTSEVILAQIGNQQMVHLVQPELLPFWKETLESATTLKLNQNIEFDFKFLLAKYGIHIVRMYCTMLAEQVLRAGRDGFGVSLRDLIRYHACRLISKEVRTEFIQHTGVFTEEQLYYAARDVFLLFPVFNSQNEEIKEHGLGGIALDEFRIIPAVAEMELIGLLLDREILEFSIDYYSRQKIRLQKEIPEAVNQELRRQGKQLKAGDFFAELFDQRASAEDEWADDDIDFSSPAKLKQVLESMGLDVENVKRATLKLIDHPVCKLLIEHSIACKMDSTYGPRLLNMIHPDDGRLHPRWKQLGDGDTGSGGSEDTQIIATGRMSGDFQQLPRPREIYEALTSAGEIAAVKAVLSMQLAAARIKMAGQLAKEKAEEERKAAKVEEVIAA